MKKTVIITGGNSGLGYETAQTLAASGDWSVIIAGRSPERITTAADQLRAATGQVVTPMQVDLSAFASVRQFAADFAASDHPPLHAIIGNAGLTSMSTSYTTDGIEQIFGVNHLGHFLLVNLLLPHLHEPGRIVFVSSGTHDPDHRLARLTGVPAPKYTRAYALAYPEQARPDESLANAIQHYSTSKLCNVLCTYELSRRLTGREIGVFAIDPGLMPDTMLTRELPPPLRALFRGVFMSLRHLVAGIRSVKESGTHVARLVTDPALTGRTALYFDGLRETRSSADSYDLDKARDLWETSEALTHLEPVAAEVA